MVGIFGQQQLINPLDLTTHNPDDVANGVKLSREQGGNPFAYAESKDDIANNEKLKAWNDFVQKSPKGSSYLINNPVVAAMSHDDLDNLSLFERTFRQLTGGNIENVGMTSGGFGELFNIGQRKLINTLSDLLLPPTSDGQKINPESLYGPMIGEGLKDTGKIVKDYARGTVKVPQNQQTFYDQVVGGIGQVTSQVITTPLTFGTSLYAQGADAMAEKIATDNAPQDTKDNAVLLGSLVTGLTEKWALDKLTGPLDTKVKSEIGQVLARIGIAGGAEGIQEFSENLLQDTIRQQMVNPNATIDVMKSVEEGQVGATVGAVVRSFVEAGLHIKKRNDAALKAQAEQEQLNNINQLSKASRVLQRDQATFEDYLKSVTDEQGAVTDLYIDAQTLAQSGHADKIAAAMPSVAEQLPNALATNGVIRLDVAEYASRVGNQDFAQSLVQDLKTDPDGFSANEAADFVKTKAAEELQKEFELANKNAQQSGEFEQSKEKVKQAIFDNLSQTSRFRSDINEAYSSLMASYFATRARNLGQTPEQVFNDYTVKIASKVSGGNQVLKQSTPEFSTKEQAEAKARILQKQLDRQKSKLTPDNIKFKELEIKRISDAANSLPSENDLSANTNIAYDENKFTHKAPNKNNGQSILDFNQKIEPDGFSFDNLAQDFIDNAKNNPDKKVTIYRAVASGDNADIKNGDWVTSTKQYAENHGIGVFGEGKYKIIQKEILPKNLFTDGNSIHEFGYVEDGSVLNQSSDLNRGSFDPSRNIITLLADADLSTFLHESMHFFLETDVTIAAQIISQNDIFDVSTMSKGEQQHLRDVSLLLKQVGLEGDIQQQIIAWQTMDFEEKRTYHEKVAEMGEKYFFEGRAPSIELMPVFNRFRNFMVSVYKRIKAFLMANPDAGKINNEVRMVFDRMIASEEEIALAEKARSMMPLVGTAEDFGMTEQEFADYQEQAKQATQDAITELQAKGLRDMKWLRNMQSKELKRLQKMAQAQRAEVRRTVRGEVLSEPVYRAYTMLTAKITDEDKLPAQPKIKPSNDIVDPTQDSLFVAIAKLGGIKFDEAVREWGVDPKENIKMPIFGKPVLRKNGGRSIDDIARALAEDSYIAADENGQYDINDLEQRFKDELFGTIQYSVLRDYSLDEQKAGDGIDLTGVNALRFDYDSLLNMDISKEAFDILVARKMTSKTGGIHPDFVAEYLQADGWQSGSELAGALAKSNTPQEEIEKRTDQRMTEQYAELSSEAAIQRAADMAVHNEARARLIETEFKALAKALKERVPDGQDKNGRAKTLAALPIAAKELANRVISRVRVRDIRPSQYAAAETRAIKAFERARNIEERITEKKNQLINFYLAKQAYAAQEEVKGVLRYLKKFDSKSIAKRIDPSYMAQIEAILEKYDFRQVSNKTVDKRQSLKEWIAAQEEIGLSPDIDQRLIDDANKTHYKNLTMDELRGVVESIKQIEHMGRLKTKLLNAQKQRNFEKVRELLIEAIKSNPKNAEVLNREPSNNTERKKYSAKGFLMAHLKGSTLAREFDNGKDGGIWWDTLIRPANDAADMETQLNHDANVRLTEILKPMFANTTWFKGLEGKGKTYTMGGKQRTFNYAQRVVIALNMGNAGNMQRLLDGEGWSRADVEQILKEFNADELQSIQQVWDLFESYRPKVAELEKRIYGKEPEWIEAVPLIIQSKDGQEITLRGGYFPIKYDKEASSRTEELANAETAKQAMQGVFSAANVRRSFAKTRSEEVKGRPLSYDMAGMFASLRELHHYLSWAEWVIDAQRIIRDDKIKDAIRDTHGAQYHRTLKDWVNAVAKGDQSESDAVSRAFNKIRANVSIAGLGFNVMTGALQLTGFLNGAVRNGYKYQAVGLAKLASNPLVLAKEIREKSKFMDARTNTMFQELNESLNKIRGDIGFHDMMIKYGFTLIRVMQQQVDVVTWWGAYEKAIADGHGDDMAVSIADQVVRDTQGSGLWHDLSFVQREKTLKLFTVFYNYMGTVLNTIYTQAKTAPNKQKLIADILLLTVAIPAMTALLRGGLTPGDNDEDWLWKVLREITGSALGLFVGLRELQALSNLFVDDPVDYSGTTGTKAFADIMKFAEQAKQGEVDDGFTRASINLAGDMFGIPSAQINKTIKGIDAIEQGKTDGAVENAQALMFGYKQ